MSYSRLLIKSYTRRIKMNIELTDKEFRLLMDIVYAGEHMINANREETIKKYEDVLQHIYSKAKDFGCGDLVKYDIEDKMYYETREFEDSVLSNFIEEYDTTTMYETLSFELAKRDYLNEIDDKDKDSEEERISFILDQQDEYLQEFEDSGVNNIYIRN